MQCDDMECLVMYCSVMCCSAMSWHVRQGQMMRCNVLVCTRVLGLRFCYESYLCGSAFWCYACWVGYVGALLVVAMLVMSCRCKTRPVHTTWRFITSRLASSECRPCPSTAGFGRRTLASSTLSQSLLEQRESVRAFRWPGAHRHLAVHSAPGPRRFQQPSSC